MRKLPPMSACTYFGLCAVRAQQPDARGKLLVAREHGAGVAERAQVLGGKEADALADAAHGRRAQALGCVFDHRHAVDGRQLGRAAVEVHGQQRLGARADGAGGGGGVEVVRALIDVGEHRTRTEPGDGTRGGEEGEGRGHDLITGADVERHERGQQRVRTRRHTDDRAGVGERSKLGLERFDFGSADETSAVEHAGQGGGELFAQERGFGAEVYQRYAHVKAPGVDAAACIV